MKNLKTQINTGFLIMIILIAEADLSVGAGGARSPLPSSPPIFCNYLFSSMTLVVVKQTMLFQVELIINNAHLIYVYPTIETCLTPNYLLFGRQLLLSSNTTSTVAANLTVLRSTTDKINCISNHFLDRWRHEYVVNLCETQLMSKLNIKRGKDTQTLWENWYNTGFT